MIVKENFGYSKDILYVYLKNGFKYLHQGYRVVINKKKYNFKKDSSNLENLIRDDIFREGKKLLEKEALKNRDDDFLQFKFSNESRNVDDEMDIKRIDISLILDSRPFVPELIIECKRLQGNKKNNEYFTKGINRFVNGRYDFGQPIAGMIGFIEAGQEVAIVKGLKRRLSKENSTINNMMEATFEMLSNEYDGHIYQSNHSRANGLEDIELFHLMMDFCDIIEY